MAKYDNFTSIIPKKIYPMVEKSLQTNTNKFKNAMASFLNANATQINDIAPYDIVYFKQTDIDNLFNSLGIKESDILNILKECFFWGIPYNPDCIKAPYVVVCFCAIRYFLKNKKDKEAELTTIYLLFSGKFYASLFFASFPTCPPSKNKPVMDYVVNTILNNKYDLKACGNVFNAIKSLCITYLETYKKNIIASDIDDEQIGKLLQQLRDREKKFIQNIANNYYDAYENKNYLNYETDNLTDGKEFRITDNDALKATRYTENTMVYLTSNSVSLDICNKCKDGNIKATEVKDIMESIIMNKNNLSDIRRVVNIIICDFMRNYPNKSVGSVDFIAYTIKMKPNTKEPYLIELKTIVLSWLDENSENYRRRKSRLDTAMSYYKAVLMYLALAITYANK